MRAQGGKDAASPRYVFTSLTAITRTVFPENDDALLTYLDDDGQRIEPEWYASRPSLAEHDVLH
jgi:DNA topoisomerase II